MADKIIATKKMEMDALDLMDFLNTTIGENNKIVYCPIYSDSGESFSVVTLKQNEDGGYELELS